MYAHVIVHMLAAFVAKAVSQSSVAARILLMSSFALCSVHSQAFLSGIPYIPLTLQNERRFTITMANNEVATSTQNTACDKLKRQVDKIVEEWSQLIR